MRTIETHNANGSNALTITVTDEPGADGANCRYMIGGFNTAKNPSRQEPGDLGR